MRLARRDIGLALVLGPVFLLPATPAGGCGCPGLGLGGWALGLVNVLPLLGRSHHPLAGVGVMTGAYAAWVATGMPIHLLQSLPVLVMLYALGSSPLPARRKLLGLVTPAVMLGMTIFGDFDGDLLEIAYVATVFVGALALGAYVADRRSTIALLHRQADELQAARRELADRAVAAERSRIARELHDVVAHAMSVITVRAGVAAHVLTDRPDEAARALQVIEATGREALGEMRRMLTVLRPDDEDEATEPQPGVGRLPALVSQLEAAGVPVTLRVEGEPRPLSPGLDLSAYRIVQEALTNTTKHAAGTSAAVTVTYGPDHLALEVIDDGPPAAQPVPGQGLQGMAERVALFGGTLEAGPGEKGFRVYARFPVRS